METGTGFAGAKLSEILRAARVARFLRMTSGVCSEGRALGWLNVVNTMRDDGRISGGRDGTGEAIHRRRDLHQPPGRDARVLGRAYPPAVRGIAAGRRRRAPVSLRIARIGAENKSRARSADAANRWRVSQAVDLRSADADAAGDAGSRRQRTGADPVGPARCESD